MKKIIYITALVLALMMLITSCSKYGGTKEDKQVVAKCGDEDIYLEEYRYLYYAHKADMIDEFGEKIFEGERAEEYNEILKERIKADIVSYSTIIAVGKECGLNMKKGEVKKSINKTVDNTVSSYENKKAYTEALKKDNMTHDFFKYLIGVNTISDKLFNALTEKGKISAPTEKTELVELIKNNMFKATHVYVPFNYAGKTKEENRQKIEEIYSNLNSNSIDFNKAVFEGCTDTSLSDGGNDYFIGYTEEVFENTVLSLKEGEYSAVFEMNGAFYIVKRLPLDLDYIEKDVYTLRDEYLKVLYNHYMTDYSKNMTFELYDVSAVQ